MIFRIVFFILTFISALYAQNEGFSEKPTPEWVKVQNLSPQSEPSDEDCQQLLIDSQDNWGEKTHYNHIAYKILTQIGLEQGAELFINFNPAFEKLVIHDIRIKREGKWLDRKNSFHMLNKQNNDTCHNFYNNGLLTLTYILEDVQVDDIVDYSYSLVGENPVFDSFFSRLYYLQDHVPVEHIFVRVIGQKDLPLQIKPLGTNLEPKIIDISPSLREWIWEYFKTSAYERAYDEPSWYNPQSQVFLSGYKNWREFIQTIIPLFKLDDFEKNSSLEMRDLVQTWMESSVNPFDRALKALRFVQDEVRYLSLQGEIHNYKPFDPNLVFQRRFGDCKDKAFLLCFLLNLMDIKSTIVLVNALNHKIPFDAVPSPYSFNHAILQIKIGEAVYFVDPTISHQGGTLQTNWCPNYEWGLLISDDSNDLTAIPKSTLEKPAEIESSFILTSDNSVDFKKETTLYGMNADNQRGFFKDRGKEFVKKEIFSQVKQAFKKAEPKPNSFDFSDDREKNVLKITEFYSVNITEFEYEKIFPFFSVITRNHLNFINKDREAPFVLTYPLWIKEHIRIENPLKSSSSFSSKYISAHESFLFNFFMEKNNKGQDYYLELKHLQDYVPKESLQSYFEEINNIDIFIPDEIVIQ